MKFYSIVILLILASIAVSFGGGMLVNLFVGGIRSGLNDNPFLQGAILKIPLLIIYLAYIYRTFAKFGFIDSQKKEYIFPLKTMAVLFSSFFMMSDTIYDSMFKNYSSFNSLASNLHTAFTPNIDLYANSYTVDANFSMIAVIISIVFVMAVQVGVGAFAYDRGKNIFVKEHLRDNDYETYTKSDTLVNPNA